MCKITYAFTYGLTLTSSLTCQQVFNLMRFISLTYSTLCQQLFLARKLWLASSQLIARALALAISKLSPLFYFFAGWPRVGGRGGLLVYQSPLHQKAQKQELATTNISDHAIQSQGSNPELANYSNISHSAEAYV